jgi:hypothetical protein
MLLRFGANIASAMISVFRRQLWIGGDGTSIAQWNKKNKR